VKKKKNDRAGGRNGDLRPSPRTARIFFWGGRKRGKGGGGEENEGPAAPPRGRPERENPIAGKLKKETAQAPQRGERTQRTEDEWGEVAGDEGKAEGLVPTQSAKEGRVEKGRKKAWKKDGRARGEPKPPI